ncbi:ATP-binding protein [Cocleimonas sp. KMM 6892]|uniref:hybrid sensor histidine kinase/response regulator n=1 Tax=unclassified Cocleimonas TaxID=2639732 RepID=UPI002DB6755B|nr:MULTISPECIES: ATP-binding protein [unclassified Cocleimonas]MEB8430829.1 ATP-binding protein [Cocleimonas sp. KMM 6892]MEC4714399.1 ATP-binding protein [Cocleimonas sp. KMM 6895]MEC4743730.1 ATP-binding protein [Cocleimonas sp. KMM 6896]
MISGLDQNLSENKTISETSNELELLARQYEGVINNLKEVVFQADIEGRWTFLNPAWETITGFSVAESLGKKYLNFVHINDRADNHSKFIPLINQDKDSCTHEVRYTKKSGEIVWIEVYAGRTYDEKGEVTGITGTLTDVTTKRLLDDEIRRTQRLESVGLLAAGIAHDFNNLLTVVLSNLSYMGSKPIIQNDGELDGCVMDAQKAGARAKDLTQQLLTFAKGGAPICELTNIIETVKDAVALGVSGTEVSTFFEVAENIPQIEVDAGQISQAVHNVVLNAVEAMATDGEVKVEILFNKNKRVKPESSSEGEVLIKISDSGIGMSEETLEHLFDPYYSTKKRGSGLGLALVHSIIERHSGRVRVVSELGKGTTVNISLPGSCSAVRDVPKTSPEPKVSGGRVLVLDDNEQILRAITLLLRTINFEVETVVDGDKAVESYLRGAKEGRPFDVVISDLTIPDSMDGIETVQKIKEIDPDVVAIVSSGYSNDPVMSDPLKYGFKGVLEKPYSVDRLKTVLQSVLS